MEIGGSIRSSGRDYVVTKTKEVWDSDHYEIPTQHC